MASIKRPKSVESKLEWSFRGLITWQERRRDRCLPQIDRTLLPHLNFLSLSLLASECNRVSLPDQEDYVEVYNECEIYSVVFRRLYMCFLLRINRDRSLYIVNRHYIQLEGT